MMDDLLKTAEDKMNKTVEALGKAFAAIRAGRATPAVLDRIQVDYYGVPTPIGQMAAVAVTEARVLQIQPWDASTVRSIEKALLASDIGITPQSDGKIIRLCFPPLTEERRREIVKDMHRDAEEAKVAVRSVRRDILEKYKAMKKSSEITEDDLKEAEKSVQTLTDKFVKIVDDMAAAKEKEVLEI